MFRVIEIEAAATHDLRRRVLRDGDPQAVTEKLREYVDTILPKDPDRPFEPLRPA